PGGAELLGRAAFSRSFQAVPREGALAAVRVSRIAQEVVLILGLVLEEAIGLADLGHGLPGPVARGVYVADRLLGHPALLLARVEDLRAVDGADDAFIEVGSMDLEEVLE